MLEDGTPNSELLAIVCMSFVLILELASLDGEPKKDIKDIVELTRKEETGQYKMSRTLHNVH